MEKYNIKKMVTEIKDLKKTIKLYESKYYKISNLFQYNGREYIKNKQLGYIRVMLISMELLTEMGISKNDKVNIKKLIAFLNKIENIKDYKIISIAFDTNVIWGRINIKLYSKSFEMKPVAEGACLYHIRLLTTRKNNKITYSYSE